MTVMDRAATRPSGDLTSAADLDGQPRDLFAWLRRHEISGPRRMPVRFSAGPRSSA